MDEIGAKKPVSSMTVRDAIPYLRTVRDGDEQTPGCPDEPVFILRARDILAPAAVFGWAASAERHGIGLQKLAGAWEAAGKMLAWPHKRMPD
jgi:hypothetical protein